MTVELPEDEDAGAPTPPGEDRLARLAAAAANEIARLAARPLEPGLHLVATPIGNLGDVTLRALVVLAQADLVYCEDTRVSRTLLAHYGIGRRLAAYHEHNAAVERQRILQALGEGRTVALISDAGTPLVSDPGHKLAVEAIAAGHLVRCLPGPSAALAGLSVSGLPSDAFLFAGFLPSRQGARRGRLAELSGVAATLIFYESPARAAASLADMAEVMGPDRPAVLAREITKRFEEVRRGTLSELAESAGRDPPRGEVVVLVGPPVPRAFTDQDIEARLAPLVATMRPGDAARTVAEALGVPRARVYDLAVGLRRKASE